MSSCNINWFDTTAGIYGAEQLPVSVATSYSMEVFERSTVHLVLLAAVQVPSSRTNRMLLAALRNLKTHAGTTQEDINKTLAKMLPQLQVNIVP